MFSMQRASSAGGDVLGRRRKFGNSVLFRAEFGIVHKSSPLHARISTVAFVDRAFPRHAANECIFHTLRAFFCVAFCNDASRYILYFRDTFNVKTACLLSDMVLDRL